MTDRTAVAAQVLSAPQRSFVALAPNAGGVL
jgi:hypothetical protein